MKWKTMLHLPLSLTVFSFLFFTSCEDILKDKHQEVYDDPPWLGGSIIETLEERGNYTIFLDLMEKVGYREPMEKGLFTVFVANDSSYLAYFDKIGANSLDDISERDALQMFTLNVLDRPWSRDRLIYEYAFGEWGGPGSELGALMWRKPTNGESPLSLDSVRYDEDYRGEILTIRSQQKYMPLISTEYFRDYFASPDGSDYTYFFPETPWSGLQWYNANVVEAEVRASNGFIYFLDKAVPVVPSIEEYLRDNQDTYGIFYDIAQRFADYRFVGLDDDEDKTRLYEKSYSGFSDIASETLPRGYTEYLKRDAFSAFIPDDEILGEYLNNTIFKYYESLDSVPEVTLLYILQAHITEHFEVPSKIVKGFFNYYGDILPIDPYTDVENATLLSNGAFFGINKILEPNAFKAVSGPLFYNSNYTTILYALNESQILTSLSREDVKASVFVYPNEKLESYGIRYEKNKEDLEYRDLAGIWQRMDDEQIKTFSQDLIIYKEIEDFSGTGFYELSSGNFIKYDNNKLWGGGNFEDGDFANIIDQEDSEFNGILYHLDNAIKMPENDIAKHIADNPDFSAFFDLLYAQALLDSVEDSDNKNVFIPRIKFLNEAEQWTAFIPTNDAMITAESDGTLPVDSLEREQFIRYHFVKDYVIFNDGELSGEFKTARIDSIVDGIAFRSPVQINNSPGSLQVTDHSGALTGIKPEDANTMVKYAVVHSIDQAFKY